MRLAIVVRVPLCRATVYTPVDLSVTAESFRPLNPPFWGTLKSMACLDWIGFLWEVLSSRARWNRSSFEQSKSPMYGGFRGLKTSETKRSIRSASRHPNHLPTNLTL